MPSRMTPLETVRSCRGRRAVRLRPAGRCAAVFVVLAVAVCGWAGGATGRPPSATSTGKAASPGATAGGLPGTGAAAPQPTVALPVASPRVLLITAHPDDETMFDLGRFRERGWDVSVALVTNGEAGKVVQAIQGTYDPQSGPDVLLEKAPGRGTWLTVPPLGPRLREIRTPVALAKERRREFIASLSCHGVTRVFFLSSLGHPAFRDGWDIGVTTWDTTLLAARLETIARRVRPDVVITLDPDETWAHPQHWGLARIVLRSWDDGAFDSPGAPRPALYGIRENGWYFASLAPESGDESFDRTAWSPVIGMTYAAYWTLASSAYISQSSQPVWFAARVRAGLLPGYGGVDLIRRLDAGSGRPGLGALFERWPPDAAAMARLPRRPAVTQFPSR